MSVEGKQTQLHKGQAPRREWFECDRVTHPYLHHSTGFLSWQVRHRRQLGENKHQFISHPFTRFCRSCHSRKVIRVSRNHSKCNSRICCIYTYVRPCKLCRWSTETRLWPTERRTAHTQSNRRSRSAWTPRWMATFLFHGNTHGLRIHHQGSQHSTSTFFIKNAAISCESRNDYLRPSQHHRKPLTKRRI